MNEPLFRPVDQNEGPLEKGESTFEFLQRGGRKEMVGIRQWMEEWYKEYPCSKKEILKRRLQSKNERRFVEALFELQIHAILRRLGCLIEIEPSFPGTDGTVDFYATNNDQKFYVEATVWGMGQGILRSNPNEQDAVQKITDNLVSPHSSIWMEANGELRTTLGTNRVIQPFKDLLNKHSAEKVRRIYDRHGEEGVRHYLSTEITEGDWVLKGWLRPPASHGRGKVWGPSRSGGIDGVTLLKNALSKKVADWKKKKLENEIFLIAVNACHSEFWWDDEKEALFGDEDIEEHEAFLECLSSVNGTIVFSHARPEINSPARMYQNGNKLIPDCLQFLLQQRTLGDLLGV